MPIAAKTTVRRLIIWAGLANFAIFAFSGCHRPLTPAPSPASVLATTAGHIEQATALNQVLVRRADDLPASPIIEARPVLAQQAEALAGAKQEAADAAQTFAGRETALATERDDARRQYQALRSDLFVRAAILVKHAIIVITTIWLIAGLAGCLLTAFGGGVWFTLGRHLLALLPLANLFTGASWWIESRTSGRGQV